MSYSNLSGGCFVPARSLFLPVWRETHTTKPDPLPEPPGEKANRLGINGKFWCFYVRYRSSSSLSQPFQDLENRRANGAVFQRKGHHLVNPAPVGVGILAARPGPYIINGAVVVATQEGAGHRPEDIVAILIHHEVLPGKFRWFYTQEGRYPLHVGIGNPGSEGAAAVGTVEAVEGIKHRLMQGMYPLVEPAAVGG